MHVKGWVKSSLVDYPGRIAASLFCGGCNFFCPNCHNADLVLHPNDIPDIEDADIWEFLDSRQGLLDGIAISGGEPTLQQDLVPFALRLHDAGFSVKLDTNGYRPDVLQAMMTSGAVDYVAMDVKAPPLPEKYALAAGREIDVSRILRSIDLLRGSEIEHEFRTTLVPGILEQEDIVQIAQCLAGANRYFLQQFVPRNTLDAAMMDRVPYPSAWIREMADACRPWVDLVAVRGV